MTALSLPSQLVEYVRSGQAVLLLCSGSANDASHSSPSERSLAKLLAEKFLDSSFSSRSLSELVELAASERSLRDVQEFIAAQYLPLQPSPTQLFIPSFAWIAIASTQIDIAIERAYALTKPAIQHCVPFVNNSQSVEAALSLPQGLMYLKLHGCVTYASDTNNPLILSPEQYPTHLSNRSLLFERLENLAAEYPFLILTDTPSAPDARALIRRLTSTPSRPRSYIVAKTFSPADERLLEGRKLTTIAMGVDSFLRALDGDIPRGTRSLATLITHDDIPIRRRFAVGAHRTPTAALAGFLEDDAEYLYVGRPSLTPDPKDFYRGHLHDWSPIEHRLDIERTLTDDVLAHAIADDEEAGTSSFYLIKGHAGSGKSVILRRLAWEAAMTWDRLSLYVRPTGQLSYEPLSELADLCRQRIYLFVDQVTDHADSISAILSKARRDHLPLTVIGTERHHAWNMLGTRLAPLVNEVYELRYLNEREIDRLIDTLERHNSLGHLEGRPLVEQREALAKRAGRQLLVALHEATLGKPFTDIVLDEYKSISSTQARSLYLTICVLHRLGVQTRAGLISRVHGIPFHEFKSEFFSPLESIVFARARGTIHDHYYESRHSHIAEIVFEGVLTDAQSRYDEYIRLLNALDTGYAADKEAFRYLINAKELRRLFPDPQMVRRLYTVALSRYPNDPAVLQQLAMFEMKHATGNLDAAGTALDRAHTLAPHNSTISHSTAELLLRRAERSHRPLERERLRSEARDILRSQLSRMDDSSHTYHSLLKIDLAELRDIAIEADETTIQRKIREVEKLIADALQRTPNDEYILEAEATFAEIMDNQPRAFAALKRAFHENPSSPYIAVRLAKTQSHQGDEVAAISTLRKYLDLVPHDKDVHYQLARFLMESGMGKDLEVLHHLRESFTKGDTRYEAQFWYARALYLDGQTVDAKSFFRGLSAVDVAPQERSRPKGIVRDKRYSGTIARVEASYAYIRRDVSSDLVFTHASGDHSIDFSALKPGMRVTFDLAFNLKGPIALGVDDESAGPGREALISLHNFADCDIGIIVALKEEFRELVAALGKAFVVEKDKDLGHHYYKFKIAKTDGGASTCIATMIGDMGPEKAVLLAERFINKWKPGLLIVVGIAASLSSDIRVGDVVVATQIDLYVEAGKAEDASKGAGQAADAGFALKAGGSVYRAPRELVETVRNLEFAANDVFDAWKDRCRRRWMASVDPEARDKLLAGEFVRESPALEECHLASGPVVGASTAFADWLKRRERQTKALDMESGGAMVAASERVDPQRTLILRGISDFGDARKAEFDKVGAGALRRYAMQNSVDLLLALIASDLLDDFQG